MGFITTAGINVQHPWSRLILSKDKTIETRQYPLPKKYLGKNLALIETPGPRGQKEGIASMIIGLIVVSKCYKYTDKDHWVSERCKHLVIEGDPVFGYFEGKAKWAWIISETKKINPQAPPEIRGIKYAKRCRIEV